MDPIIPQYIADLTTWTAIGARSAKSQPHREMASGLSTAFGVRNTTDSSIAPAINALMAIREPHHFLGVTQKGRLAVFRTAGNRCGHVILRGGLQPNYSPAHVQQCERDLMSHGLPANIMVDCSHGNSGKDPGRQAIVLDSCIEQVVHGNQAICGFMLESNLAGGSQSVSTALSELDPNQSITDPCLDWRTTETLLLDAHERLKKVIFGRRRSYRFCGAID